MTTGVFLSHSHQVLLKLESWSELPSSLFWAALRASARKRDRVSARIGSYLPPHAWSRAIHRRELRTRARLVFTARPTVTATRCARRAAATAATATRARPTAT